MPSCRGCGAELGMKHYSDCAFAHPWPRHRVDHVQTRVAPVGVPPDYDPGPWWWRLRCDLADLLGRWACAVKPEDESSVGWQEGEHIVIVRARRRA